MKLDLNIKNKQFKRDNEIYLQKKRGFLFIININDFLKKTGQRTLTTIL